MVTVARVYPGLYVDQVSTYLFRLVFELFVHRLNFVDASFVILQLHLRGREFGELEVISV